MTAPKVDLKQLIREEYKRCATSPAYFIWKYCYIQHPIRGKILPERYGYQEDAVASFMEHDYTIVLKGRQIGISTVVALLSLWMMLFHKDKNILVIATKQDTAKNLITKVRYAYDHLPIWLQVECVENNKLSLRFKNGSTIKASTAAGDSGRSEGLSLLILDEAAFIKNAEEIWVAAFPTLSTGGKAILISTPNGVGNFFHRTYSKAIQGITNENAVSFHPIKLDWKVHPDRDQKWRDRMGEIQGEREARQEFDAEFIGSGNTVVDADLIEWYNEFQVQDPEYKMGLDGNVWVWENPDYTRKYIIAADVARGDGKDYSSFHVIDVVNVRQVAEYKGQLSTTDFGHLLVEMAVKYNDALLVVERENVGWAVLQTIIDRNYHNLFYMSKDHKVVETQRTLTSRFYSEEQKMVAGFGTTSKTRPLIISKLDTYMREKAVEIRSFRLIEELRVFIWENQKAQAMEGMNDDLVMAFCIALWIRDVALKLQIQGVEQTKFALDHIQRSSHEGVYTPHNLPVNPWTMPTGTQEHPEMDLRWLLG